MHDVAREVWIVILHHPDVAGERQLKRRKDTRLARPVGSMNKHYRCVEPHGNGTRNASEVGD
jgi:hypothetical protein